MVVGVRDPQRVLESVILQDAILAGLTIGLFWLGVFVVRRFGNSSGYSLAALGFSRPRTGALAGIGIGLLVGVGALLLAILVNPVSAYVLSRFGYSTKSNIQGPLMEGLQGWVQQSPALAIPAMILVVVVIGPAVEELTFRGGLFNALYRLGRLASKGSESKRFTSVVERVSFAAAALVSSSIFALLHGEPVLFPMLLILAVALCFLFKRTESLLSSFVAHATFNSSATLLIILSGLGVFKLPI